MKLSSCALAALGLIALASLARAQGQCPITAKDLEGIDFKPAAAACNSIGRAPNAAQCDGCAAALFKPLVPRLAQLGFSCDDVVGLDTDALTAVLTPCINVVLPSLQRGGVSTSALLGLRACEATPGPLVSEVALSACPNLAPEIEKEAAAAP